MNKVEIGKDDDNESNEDNFSHFIVGRNGSDVSYFCPKCGRTFTSITDYATHKHYKPPINSERFPSIRAEINNELAKYGPYAKDLDTVLSTLVSKGSHNMKGKEYYECTLGDNKAFQDKTLLEYHLIKFHGEELYELVMKLDFGKSDWRFGRNLTEGQINELINELAEKSIVGEFRGNYKYKDPIHKTIFYSLERFKQHILSSHTEGELLSMLGKLTPEDLIGSEEQVSENVRFNTPTGGTFYRCPVDGYRFKTKDEFKQHFLTHTPAQRFQNVLWRKDDVKRKY